MIPDPWILLLLFLAGAVCAWFAMVRTVRHETGPGWARTTAPAEAFENDQATANSEIEIAPGPGEDEAPPVERRVRMPVPRRRSVGPRRG